MDCSYMYSKHLTKKPKKPWVFLVFCLSSSKTSFKKPKNPRFFLVFKNLNQKKTKKTQGKPKKNIFWPETKTSPKSFGFLVFSRFRKNPFLLKEKSSGPPNKTKKTQGKQKKKHLSTWNQNFSINFWFFGYGFLVFSKIRHILANSASFSKTLLFQLFLFDLALPFQMFRFKHQTILNFDPSLNQTPLLWFAISVLPL